MKKIFNYCILFLVLVTTTPAYSKSSICVNNQKGFDSLNERINELVNEGEKSIYIYLKPGEYVANGNQIKLARLNAPDIEIHFIGKKNVFVVPQGKVYRNGDLYQGEFSVNRSWMSGANDLEIWSSVKYADGVVEVINEGQKSCRLKASDKIQDDLSCDYVFIMIPAWYQTYYYKVSKIEGGYIYFTADNLNKSYNNGYNVNDDYNYAKKKIRYKLCNTNDGEDHVKILNGKVVLPKGISTAREGQVNNIVTIRECVLGTIEIKGINFYGNRYEQYSSLIAFENTDLKKGLIHDCSFFGIKSTVIDIISTSNVSVCNNNFKDCYNHGVISDNKSHNTVVRGNCLRQMGKRMFASSSISCKGKDYYISDNTLMDYGYCGISVGVWFGTKAEEWSCGIIENNKLIYTDPYIANIENTGIMDGGGIYVGTKNDGAVIRYNVIKDYTGIKDNRGIFCDDGTYGVQIYGNVITGIVNNYSIDCRRVKKVEASAYPASGIERSNINNVIRDNIVDSPIRFEGHEDSDNGCYKGCNYILSDNDSLINKSVYQNVKIDNEDISLSNYGLNNGNVVVSRSDYKQLKRSQNWNKIKRHIKRR